MTCLLTAFIKFVPVVFILEISLHFFWKCEKHTSFSVGSLVPGKSENLCALRAWEKKEGRSSRRKHHPPSTF